MRKSETYDTARMEILGFILQFCTGTIYGAEDAAREFPRGTSSCGFVSCFGGQMKPKIGDLVRLESVAASKWSIGWLVEMRELHAGWPEYLIRSLEDGTLCWWGNVGISFLHRGTLEKHPNWRWTDRQWAFHKRWFKVCYEEKDAYIVRPLMAQFGEGYSVTLGTRTMHGFDDIRPERSYPDFRKVTKAMMAEVYDHCVAERERILGERKAVVGPSRGKKSHVRL